MKNFFVLFWLMISVNFLFGQNIFTEDFGGSSFPPQGWTIDAYSGNWSQSSSVNAGGESPEAKFSWSPQFEGVSRLISPVFDISGVSGGVALVFKHYVDDYAGGYSVGVAIKSGNDDWQTIWEKSVSSDIGPEQVVLQLPAVSDSASVQVCWFFNGNSYNIDYWFIDDIKISILNNLNLSLEKTNFPKFIYKNDTLNLTGTVFNMGLTDINSFSLKLKINDDTLMQDFTGLNISSASSYDFAWSQPVVFVNGINDIKIWVENVNDTADDYHADDTLSYSVYGASAYVANVPLYEEFTSSTCSPCATFNSNIFNPFLASHPDVTCVKYQMYWPGDGDPYYIEDGGIRKDYYGVSYVPWLEAGGSQVSNTSDGVNNSYSELKAKKSFVDLKAFYNITGDSVFVSVEFTPFINFDNASLLVAVVEDTTTGNASTNGETEFYHVLMKMLPDGHGTKINLTDSLKQMFYFKQDMSGTNVEEMDDLSVVVFIQNDDNKEIMQSCWAQKGVPAIEISYNIAENSQVAPDTVIKIFFNTPVRLLSDAELTADSVTNIIRLTTSSGEEIPYTAEVNDQKTQITLTPQNGLPENSTVFLSVPANKLENYQDQPFAGDTLKFYTFAPAFVNAGKLPVFYPNPASDFIFVKGLQDFDYQIVTVTGKIVASGKISANLQKIDLDLNSGEYLLRFVNKDVILIRKLLIKN